jgi:hypothetical protein
MRGVAIIAASSAGIAGQPAVGASNKSAREKIIGRLHSFQNSKTGISGRLKGLQKKHLSVCARVRFLRESGIPSLPRGRR